MEVMDILATAKAEGTAKMRTGIRAMVKIRMVMPMEQPVIFVVAVAVICVAHTSAANA